MKYIITEEIESPAKVVKGIEVFDFFFILFYLVASFVLSNLVYSGFKIIFMIFSLLMATFLTLKSFGNKKRRNFESILLLLRKDIVTYKPFIREKEKRHE